VLLGMLDATPRGLDGSTIENWKTVSVRFMSLDQREATLRRWPCE
jgi:hypothetical protein